MKVQDHSLMDPDIQETPFAYYDALLEQAPVYFMPEIQAYVISKLGYLPFSLHWKCGADSSRHRSNVSIM